MVRHPTFGPCLLFLVAALPAFCPGQTQELPPQQAARLPLLEQVRDVNRETVILDDLDLVARDVNRLLKDLGLAEYSGAAEGFLRWEGAAGAFQPGIAFYRWGESCQLKGRDPAAIRKLLKVTEAHSADGKPFAPVESVPFMVFMGDAEQAVIDGDNLLLVNHAWNDDREQDRIDRWLGSRNERLWPRLDPGSQAVLLQTGLAMHYRPEDGRWNESSGLDDQLVAFGEQLTPAERQWLETMRETVFASDRQLFGMKYHERVMELRGRAQIGGGRSFDALVRPGSWAEDWQPDLGLEREQLALAAVFQMNAFPSPAAARILPRLALHAGGEADGFDWLRGNMLRTLTELVGDSWNDLESGRVALYLNDDGENAGMLAIIGIADSRDPAVVRAELQRMARLTSPEAASIRATERDQEIARLVDDLASDDSNVANRAETRLALAGQAAKPLLEKAAEGWNQNQLDAADRLLRRLERPANNADLRRSFSDPGFWTTLNPGLGLKLAAGKTGGFETHVIDITPDSSKTPEEVAGAIRLMEQLFGKDWATIRVVEAGRHFVFMLGSDQGLLERTVANVAAGRQVLSLELAGVGHCRQTGQLQLWAHGQRLLKLVSDNSWGDDFGPKADNDQPAWLGIAIEGTAVEASALIPVEHLIPVVSIMF